MAFAGGRALRVPFRRLRIVVWVVRIRDPLPNVACHVVKSVVVRGELPDGGGILVKIIACLAQKIGFIPALFHIGKGEYLIVATGPGRIFPFRLRRQAAACPGTIIPGILPGNVDNRIARYLPPLVPEGRAWHLPVWLAPQGFFNPPPP